LGPLAERAEAASSIDAFLRVAKDNPRVRTNEQNISVDSAMVPAPIAAELKDRQIGSIRVMRGPQGFALEEIIKAEKAPIGYDTAKRRLERQLFVRRQQETMENQIKHLRQTAKITYLNGFSEIKPKDGSVEDKSLQTEQPAVTSSDTQTTTQPENISANVDAATAATAPVAVTSSTEAAADEVTKKPTDTVTAAQKPAEVAVMNPEVTPEPEAVQSSENKAAVEPKPIKTAPEADAQ